MLAGSAQPESVQPRQGRGDKGNVAGAAAARVEGGDLRIAEVATRLVKLREQRVVLRRRVHRRIHVVEKRKHGGRAGQRLGHHRLHPGAGLGELRRTQAAEVATHERPLRDDVRLARHRAARARQLGLGTAGDQRRIDGHAVQLAQLLIKSLQDAGGLEHRPAADRSRENAPGRSRGALHLERPPGVTPAGHRARVADRRFKREGQVAVLRGVKQLPPAKFAGIAHRFLIAVHDDRDLRVGQQPGPVQGTQCVEHDNVATLHVRHARAGNLVAGPREIRTRINRVEVANEQDALALGPAMFGDEVTRAAGRSRQRHEAALKTQLRQLLREELPQLPDARQVLRRAVNLHRLPERRPKVIFPCLHRGDEPLLLGRERSRRSGRGPAGSRPRHEGGQDQQRAEDQAGKSHGST